MTAQISETLLYDGRSYSLFSTPLDPFLETTRHPIKLAETNTALWRGYVGTWSIEDDHLYLVDLKGGASTGDEVGLKDIFPDATDGVFAHWFTGDLRCPMGELLSYRHMGFGSQYEKDFYFHIRRGIVQAKQMVYNQAAPTPGTGATIVSS